MRVVYGHQLVGVMFSSEVPCFICSSRSSVFAARLKLQDGLELVLKQ